MAVTHVFVIEAHKNLDLSESSLTIGLMLKRTNLLDGHSLSVLLIGGRAAYGKSGEDPQVQICRDET